MSSVSQRSSDQSNTTSSGPSISMVAVTIGGVVVGGALVDGLTVVDVVDTEIDVVDSPMDGAVVSATFVEGTEPDSGEDPEQALRTTTAHKPTASKLMARL